MKVYYADPKRGAKVRVDSLDDLWYLYQVIEQGDLVGGKTTRSVRKHQYQEKRRRKMFVKLEVEKTEFKQFSPVLRIVGRIMVGPEDISRGYHSLQVGEKDLITIEKEDWKKFQFDLLRKAEKESQKPEVLIVAFRPGEAAFGIMTSQGLKKSGSFHRSLSRREKNYEDQVDDYYFDLWDRVKAFMKEKGIEKVIMAGTGFSAEIFKWVVDPEGEVYYDKVMQADWRGVQEVLRRGTIKHVMKKSRLEDENELMEEFLKHLNKDDGLSVYGLEESYRAALQGAVKDLFVLDRKLHDGDAKKVISAGEESGADVHVFSSETEPGQNLKSFGGVAGILRYNYKG